MDTLEFDNGAIVTRLEFTAKLTRDVVSRLTVHTDILEKLVCMHVIVSVSWCLRNSPDISKKPR